MQIINPYRFEEESATSFDGFGNRSRSFNGVDDYISIADNADFPTGAQTICCWVKFNTLNSGASGQDLITHWTTADSNNASFAIYMPNASNGKVRFYVSADGLLHSNVEALDAVSALEWSHVACVFTPNDSIKIYINGSLSNTLATTGISSLYNSSVDLVLGGRDQVSVTTPLNGKLADFRFYDTDLTATDISDIYNGINITTNLVGHGLIDADNVLDAVGTSHGTNYGTKYSYDNPSPPVEFGRASRSFNGTSDYIDCGDILDSVWNGTGKKFTFATWIKTDALDDGVMMSKLGTTSNGRTWFARIRTNGEIAILVYQSGTISSSRFGRETSTSGSISAGVWTHCAFVYDQTAGAGNFLKMYIDGVEATTLVDYFSNGSFTEIAVDNTTPVQISGAESGTITPFGGYLADMRIYDTDLTASQVSDLYAGTDVQTNLVGHWLTDNDDVEDKAGTNDGTNFGSTYSYDNPPMDLLIPSRQASRSFDGGNDYVDLGDSLDSVFAGTGKQWSFTAWVKADTLNDRLIFAKWHNSLAGRAYFIRILSSGDLGVSLSSDGTTNNRWGKVTNTSPINTNTWHHVAVSYDQTATGNYIRLWVDGVEDTNPTDYLQSGTFTSIYDGSATIQISGINGTGTQNFDGKIADVRIYDTDLTASQILDIYNGTTDRTNLIGQWLTNSDDVLDHAGTNDGTNNGSTYSTDSPS
jgi:hypothetical protein